MGDKRKNSLSGDQLKKALEAACRGLVYISETDSPVTPIFIDRNDQQSVSEYHFLIEKLSKKNDAEQAASQFFDRLTSEKDWHTQREKLAVGKYRRLEKLIFDNLKEIRLIRQGLIRVYIFLVGEDAEGNIAGIRTFAVET